MRVALVIGVCACVLGGCGARSGLLSRREDGGVLDRTRQDRAVDRTRDQTRVDRTADRSRLPDLKLPPAGDFVYAHSAGTLYRLDPSTLALVTIGAFAWPKGSDSMTDLALSRGGLLVGISYGSVYAVNPKTAACILLSPLPDQFNALAFLPTTSGGEELVAVASSGSVYRLDPATGKPTLVGSYGGGYESSGDLSWTDAGVLATVSGPGSDLLVKVDPSSGKATAIGPIGAAQVWGLAEQHGKLFGFSYEGKVLLIDKKGGSGKVVGSVGASFWGAAAPAGY